MKLINAYNLLKDPKKLGIRQKNIMVVNKLFYLFFANKGL